MESSPAAEVRVRELAAKLERFHERITSCRVVIDAASHRQHQGNLFAVRIDITLPGRELFVDSERDARAEHTDLYVALRDAFDAARRQLQDDARRRRGDVKHHVQIERVGLISEIDANAGFGRIETDDGRLIYFHRNSVHDVKFDDMAIGTRVVFVEGAGDEGPQASAVRPRATGT
jgi:ribosomal subunit interface protein